MHIVLFVDTATPEVTALAIRTLEHARYWIAAGHQVTLYTGVPNFPKGKVYAGYKNKLLQIEHIDGIKIVRTWSYISANSGKLKRILDYMSLAASSFIAGLFVHKPDIIIASSPQPFIAMSTWVLAKIRRKPFVFELRDLWPESISAVGAMKPSRLLRIFGRVLDFIYKHADCIVPNTDSFKTYLLEKGIADNKIHVIKNGFDCDKLKTVDWIDKEILYTQYNLPRDKLIAGYIGTHGMAHALETILYAAKHLQTLDLPELDAKLLAKASDCHFVLMGEGARKADITALAKQLNLSHVSILPACDHHGALSMLRLCDICLIHLNKSPVFKTVIPSKIFEAMAMRKPILAGLQGESRTLIESAHAGTVVVPEDAKALAKAMLVFAADPESMRKKGDAGFHYVQTHFDRKKLAMAYLSVLEFYVPDPK